jgi:hypothetical protein
MRKHGSSIYTVFIFTAKWGHFLNPEFLIRGLPVAHRKLLLPLFLRGISLGQISSVQSPLISGPL